MTSFDSYFIGRSTAEKAVHLTLPMIHAAMANGEAGESGFLYIVIMKPGYGPLTSSFEEAILYEHAIGDRTKWDADYGAFARAKAKVAWKTGWMAMWFRNLNLISWQKETPYYGAVLCSTASSSASVVPIRGMTRRLQ